MATSICQTFHQKFHSKKFIKFVTLFLYCFVVFATMIDAAFKSSSSRNAVLSSSVISKMKSSHVSIMSWSNKGVARRRRGESFHQQMRKVYLVVVVLLFLIRKLHAVRPPSFSRYNIRVGSKSRDLPTWFSLYQKKGKKPLPPSRPTKQQPYKPFITCFWHFDFVLLVVDNSKTKSGKFGPEVSIANFGLFPTSLKPRLLHSKPTAKPR